MIFKSKKKSFLDLNILQIDDINLIPIIPIPMGFHIIIYSEKIELHVK